MANQADRRLLAAARWLANTARIVPGREDVQDPYRYPVPQGGYLGAVRNEYDTRTGVWYLNGPVWHTGQSIRAVLIAWRRTGDPALLKAALAMGEYIARNVVSDPDDPDYGLLLAYEGDNVTVNNQTVLETLPGLLDLADATDDESWLDLARRAADVVLRGFLPDEGLVVDHYHVAERRFFHDPDNPLPGRIMLDDAALVMLTERTGDARYGDAFLAMAERGLREEDPPGTWIVFPPWHRDTGRQHIRCSWWWGRPMLTAYDLTGDRRFLDAAVRAGTWYLDNQNLDGGFYYATLRDGRHGSFALATSGAAVAAILWADLHARTNDPVYLEAIGRSLRFLAAAQFSDEADDPNVRGALWETLNVPDGTTRPGFRVRDIASIFAVRAWDRLITDQLIPDEIAPLNNAMPW